MFLYFHQDKFPSFQKTLCMRDHIEFSLKPIEIDIEIFLFSVGCSIIAMSCYTSYSSETRDQLDQYISSVAGGIDSSFSFSWAYGLGWASTVIALIGATISSFGLFISSNNTGNPTMTFKS